MIVTCCEHMLNMSLSTIYDDLLEFLDDSSTMMVVAIVVQILVLLFSAYVYFHGFKSDRSAVLLLGVPGAGKTQLFAQLVSGQEIETVTSLKENEALYNTTADGKKKSKQLTIVDIPGSASIRDQILDQFKNKICGLIFVVDSENAQRNIKDVAVFLYQLLTDELINKFHPKVLIACNKQDLLVSKSKRVIQGLLESELNTVRKTQSARLNDGDDASDTAGGIFLGKKNETFNFQHLSKFDVKFCECNGKSNEEGSKIEIDDLKKWINSL